MKKKNISQPKNKLKGFFHNPLKPVSEKKLSLVTNMSILGSIGFVISTVLLSQSTIQIINDKKIAFFLIFGGSLILLAACIEFFRKNESRRWINNLLIGGILFYATSGFFLIVNLIASSLK